MSNDVDPVSAAFGIITLVLVSLFILGAIIYCLYFVGAYSFGINEKSGFGGALCMLFGMGTILYILSATYSIVSNKRR